MVPSLAIYLAVLALCLVWPEAGRVFVGLFFVVIALGVNVVPVLVAPDLFVALGTDAPLIPPYAWFFQNVVAAAPPLFGLLAAAYEIAVALLMLSKGRYARWGLAGGIVFLIGKTPLGVWTLANPMMAVALALLLRKRYDRSLPEMLRHGLHPA